MNQNDQNDQNENLSTRMKQYESELDGRSFSKFTKKFVKPFDVVFIKSMCLTVSDLVKEFNANTGYTLSDEITLIFDSKYPNLLHHLYNGRIQKLLSLTSAYCSVRFNHHLEKLIEPIKDNYPSDFIELIYERKQIFDARLLKFNESNIYEILNHQIWRSIYDNERNAILTYTLTYFE